ncbi:MAG: PAS domain S-box protein, partial [Cyanobacteriota bacterium]|nr:PAS domain S-box protein [Cyanobacteriota bacterium]
MLPDSRLISKLKSVSKAASGMVTLVGCLVLVGWMLDIPSLKSLLSNSVTMKANTAIAFLLSGMSLWLLQNKPTGRGSRLIGQALAVIVAMLGLLTLSQYLFHWNLGIDQLVFREIPEVAGTSHPGRMAPTTALNFILIGFALLLLGRRTHQGYYPVQFLSLTATLFSWQPLLGYAYGFESLYGIASYTRMALLTVLAFIVLCGGILLACPDQGLMRVVTSNSLGGFIARRLLVAAIAIPFVGGYLIIQGYQAGLYNIDFGLSLLIIVSIVIFAVWIWQNAQTLDRLDTQRFLTEQALQETNQTLQALVQASPLAILSLDAEANLKMWSPAAQTIFGWTEQEVLGHPLPFIPEDKREEYQRLHQLKLQGNSIKGLELRRQKKDGSPIDIAVWGAPLQDSQGNISSTMAIIADITERKQAIDEAARSAAAIASLNQDLQRRVSELQTLFEVIPISIAIAQDAECRHIQVNSAFAKILKIPPDANASCTPPKGAPQPTYQVCRDGTELPGDEQPLQYAAAHSTEVRDAEIDIVREDGAVFNLYGYAAPLFDEQGNARGAVSAFLDITERKRTEAALRESEERFRKFFEEAPIGICVVELNGRFLKVNKTYCQMLGYLEPELHQLTFAQITHPEDAEIDLRYAEQLFKGEISSYQIEKRYIKKNGEIVWVNLTVTMISEQDGKVCYGLGMVEDISERKRTQEALQDTNQTLQALIQACPLAITVFNLDDGLVQMWNPAAETIFGWSEQEVLGRFLPAVPEDKQHEFLANLDSIRRGETLTGLETRRQKKGDVPIDISVWAAPLRDAQGNVNCLSIVADISDRKRMEAERAQLLVREQAARTEAEAANRMKDEFLATLSHELRTPLNAMLGWTQMLRTRKFDQATTARALETIDRNTKSLATLIEDILDVSRIIRGKLHLNIRPVELISIVEAAIETVRPAATLKEIHIDSLLDRSMGVVLGDGNRLQQVVWNLLSNAVKFTPKGGRVEVRLEQGTEVGSNVPSYVQIQVSDTGKGIARDFLPYVFDRFRQENSSTTRSYGGLGLGLAIVRHLVESHGGTVSASSPGEGQGATFSVQLPLVSAFTETSERSLLDSTVQDNVPVERLSVLDGLRVLVV